MTIMAIYHHRKSAGLAIDGQQTPHVMRAQEPALDIDDIQIWLHNYLHEHGACKGAIRDDISFAQLGLDPMACHTLLAAFEFRYSISLPVADAACFNSVRACSAFLLAQCNAAMAGEQEAGTYVDIPQIFRTVIRRR